jgi:hypothetical protein
MLFTHILFHAGHGNAGTRLSQIQIALQALQVRAKFRGRLVTQMEIFLQRLRENIF